MSDKYSNTNNEQLALPIEDICDFPTEEFALSDGRTGIEMEISVVSDSIETPYDPSNIRIEPKTMTIDLIVTRIKHKEINLNPDFQRKGGIWKDDIQSKLIESLIIKIPLPAFYFDATDESNWLVVDGLQRLTALKRFIVDEDLVLVGMEYLENLNGKKFSELPRKFHRRIMETQIVTFLIQENTPPEVKFDIFKRINTGGLPLSTQEIRQTLYQGKSTHLLKELAKSDAFKKATDNGISDERMGDRECILRFLSFAIVPYTEYKEKDIEGFLNSRMEDINNMSDEQIESLKDMFFKTMTIAHSIFDRLAFRKIAKTEKGIRKFAINKALFETWSVNLSKLPERKRTILIKRRNILIEKFIELLKDNDFYGSISAGTGDPAKVKIRFEKIEQLIGEVLDD